MQTPGSVSGHHWITVWPASRVMEQVHVWIWPFNWLLSHWTETPNSSFPNDVSMVGGGCVCAGIHVSIYDTACVKVPYGILESVALYVSLCQHLSAKHATAALMKMSGYKDENRGGGLLFKLTPLSEQCLSCLFINSGRKLLEIYNKRKKKSLTVIFIHLISKSYC